MQYPQPLFHRTRRGFTLVEIVVILIIIALMLIIIVPHFISGLQARKAQGIKDDLAALNSAVEHYALDNGKVSGVELTYADLRKYVDPKTNVYRLNGKDAFGDSYGPFEIGSRPSVPAKTADKLSTVVNEDFWSPFH
jgi:type II secretory pathway pseudopilin PulG